MYQRKGKPSAGPSLKGRGIMGETASRTRCRTSCNCCVFVWILVVCIGVWILANSALGFPKKEEMMAPLGGNHAATPRRMVRSERNSALTRPCDLQPEPADGNLPPMDQRVRMQSCPD